MFLLKKYFQNEKGSTATEFGIIAIAFIAVLFSIIEGGRLFLTWNGFQYALENAARVAMVDQDITSIEVEALVDNQLDTFLMDENNASISVSFSSSASGINFIEIDGSYDYTVMVPLMPDSWSSYTLTGQSRLPRP